LSFSIVGSPIWAKVFIGEKFLTKLLISSCAKLLFLSAFLFKRYLFFKAFPNGLAFLYFSANILTFFDPWTSLSKFWVFGVESFTVGSHVNTGSFTPTI